MNGENNDIDETRGDDSSDESLVADESLTATVVITEDDVDAGGDSTIEMDIEELVAKLDDSDSEDVHRRAEIRRKLEELREQREQELDSTFNINFDEE